MSHAHSLNTGRLFVVIGNPESNRITLFQTALARAGHAPATIVAWSALLAGRVKLSDAVASDAIVRIESPGRDFGVERALLMLGADIIDDEYPEAARLSRADCAMLTDDKGLILAPRQWYLGFRVALARIEDQLADCPNHTLMNAPRDILAMFDKRRCHALLTAAGLPLPRSLGPVRSYNELADRMKQAKCSRVFVKLTHGSSASGVVAYQTNGRLHQAVTTVEMVENGPELLLYNSRRMQTYRDLPQIARLMDALCHQGVHVEQWLPKAGIGEEAFDLRVVVIAGQAQHVVVRMSRSPMTNLHLLNRRGDPGAVQERMGAPAWESAMATCERTLRCFPGSHYAGVDLLVTTDFRRHAVLEVNAFGDLLPGVLCQGLDTYDAELHSYDAEIAGLGQLTKQCEENEE